MILNKINIGSSSLVISPKMEGLSFRIELTTVAKFFQFICDACKVGDK